MAVLQDITNVQIRLETDAVSRAGFGIPIFISDHVWFTERVRVYSSITAAEEDLPLDSDAYKALQKAYAQQPKPKTVMIGRREVDNITFTPDAVTSTGQVFELTVTGTDSVAVTATFVTTTGSETATDVATALVTGLSGVTGVTVVDNTGSLTLSKSGTAAYSVKDISRLSYVTTTTEDAGDVLQEIEDENSDFYFLAANDHSEAFVMAMAAAIETRPKQYFVSLQEAGALTALGEPATDIAGKLAENNYSRTSAWFHQTADTEFPEMGFIAIGSTYDAGKIVWYNNKIAGIAGSTDPATGKKLSDTQRNNLFARNANWVVSKGGIDITRTGRVASGERIDIIRNLDYMTARLTEGLRDLQINSPIIPYTNFGIASVEATMRSILDRMVEEEGSPNILQASNPYTLTVPRAEDVPFADKAEGVLNIVFVAYLSGSIEIINVTGTLTYDNLA